MPLELLKAPLSNRESLQGPPLRLLEALQGISLHLSKVWKEVLEPHLGMVTLRPCYADSALDFIFVLKPRLTVSHFFWETAARRHSCVITPRKPWSLYISLVHLSLHTAYRRQLEEASGVFYLLPGVSSARALGSLRILFSMLPGVTVLLSFLSSLQIIFSSLSSKLSSSLFEVLLAFINDLPKVLPALPNASSQSQGHVLGFCEAGAHFQVLNFVPVIHGCITNYPQTWGVLNNNHFYCFPQFCGSKTWMEPTG